MSYGIKLMGGNDIDLQVQMMKLYPQIVSANFRPGMKEAVSVLAGNIEPHIPTLTGKAKSDFDAKVTGTGINLKGRVGWWGVPDYYINVVEHGAKPHAIKPKQKGGWLAWDAVFAREVAHPGFKGRYFMKTGFKQAQPAMNVLFAAAAEKTVQMLAINPGKSGGGRVN